SRTSARPPWTVDRAWIRCASAASGDLLAREQRNATLRVGRCGDSPRAIPTLRVGPLAAGSRRHSLPLDPHALRKRGDRRGGARLREQSEWRRPEPDAWADDATQHMYATVIEAPSRCSRRYNRCAGTLYAA